MYTYKKILSAVFILLLYTLTNPLQAANVLNAGDEEESKTESQPSSTAAQKQITVCDYTLLNNKNVNHTLDDIEDVEDDLAESIWGIDKKLVTNNSQSPLLLLGAVLQYQENQEQHQYLISSTGLLSETTQLSAVKRAHKKGFHLVQATSGHVSLQLLSWLQVSQHYTVTALYTNRPVCRDCYLIANSLWKKQLQTNEKGCLSCSLSCTG